MDVTRKALSVLTRLELFEVCGIVAVLVAMGVFVASAGWMTNIIGYTGFRWLWAEDFVGVFHRSLSWAFILALLALGILYRRLESAVRHGYARVQKAAFVVRVLMSFIISTAIYKVVNFYIRVFNPFDRDLVLQHIDRALFFGRLPSEWLEPLISPSLTAILGLCYLSWFFLTYGTIVLLLANSDRAAAEYVFTAIATFYIGYFTYALVPAIGPCFTVAFSHPLGGLTALFSSHQSLVSRDCFPSLHTGISIVMARYVWLYRRKWFWLYGPLVSLIIFSTLYLRVHYGIDVIAGSSLAVVTIYLCPPLFRLWEDWRLKFARLAHPVLDFSHNGVHAGASEG